MKNLKRLGLSVTLTTILAIAALAGETNTSACAPPAPGITETPPCASAYVVSNDDRVTQGETNIASPAKPGTEFLEADVTLALLQSVLMLF